ncbi:MAG: 1-deoxy-D-xylulose-5-phosphate reductoisomerase [Bacteroidales bacterium]|nr:1-deoxy-D-xylulose-5-phosphate reductoisomerase [Bacteroidales bacterium]MBS3773949.1 1-deoxy-D-xylulose-5-phosphate reductoisomerase [Bacteroidales bacterium]
MREKKRIAILGSTGSIGTQALEVINQYPQHFDVKVLSAKSNAELLAKQARQYVPASVVVGDETKYEQLRNDLANNHVNIYSGVNALAEIVKSKDIDLVLISLVGYAGLLPTINAIKSGKEIALANKETLVVAGDLVRSLAGKYQVPIYPVDSEHSAIYQCLVGEENNNVEKIYLTASGGPFRDFSREQMKHVSKEDALKHPNWSMGDKITIDSASLMNKGLEAIEAHWLFGLEPEQIDVVIHPQSIIHSVVQFEDGSMKAQMGLPDMKLPILYALTAPDRLKSDFKRFNFEDFSRLTFEKPDSERFPSLFLAYESMKAGGNMPCILNAANEIAVEAFLENKIGFLQMSTIVEQTMNKISYIRNPVLEDYIQTDEETRVLARSLISKKVED